MASDLISSKNRELFDTLVTAIWVYDIENYCIVWANQAALKMWESDSLEELMSRDFRPDSSEATQQALIDFQQIFKTGKTLSRIWRYSPKGILKEAYTQLSGYLLTDGRMAVLTEALTIDLIDSNSGSASVITLSTYDLNGHFLSGNPPFLESVPHDYNHLSRLFTSEDDYQRVRNIVEHTGRFEDDVQIKSKQQILWHRLVVSRCEQGGPETSLLVQQINIEQRKQKEIELEKEVITDSLTGLLNRRGLKQAVENKTDFLIYYIDLDGFKLINDSLGHNVGDQLLQHLGLKLTSGELKQGYACRFGGDEFIWLIEQDKLTMSTEQTANYLLSKMCEPYIDSEQRPVTVSASIGVAHYPNDGDDFENLILKADAAMYLAKRQGKHRWVSYISGMESTIYRQSELAKYLYQALSNQEFELHYQPIFDTKRKTVHSLEALLRWKNPVIGNVPADECIRVAEEVGILLEIEKWVINTAISDVQSFRDIFHPDIAISINVSSQYFCNPELVSLLINQLKENELSSSAIKLELTETTLISDVQQDSEVALKIHKHKIPISIDDFGTGYSSLSYLHQIPATYVKIDRSFTQRLNKDHSMIDSINNLVANLNLNTIIEGVETKEQSDILSEMKIYLQQGYGLGFPQPLAFYKVAENIQSLPGLK